MSKKLYFLISFVLVLSLGGLAQADAIEVNNPSFELDNDGCQVDGHRLDLGVGWEKSVSGFVGVDTFCPYAAEGEACHNWPGSDDPCGYVYCYIQNTGTDYIYQVLDMNNSDANAVIEEGRRYTLTIDAATEVDLADYDSSTIISSLFYGNKHDANELASKTHTVLVKSREPFYDYCVDPVIGPDIQSGICRDWNYNLAVTFVAEVDDDCITKTLGIKVTSPNHELYNFVDNVRLEWSWASTAYDPDPADEAEDVPIDVNLAWSPGLWAADVNGHEVYFGTDEADVTDANTANTALYPGIYRGPDDVVGPDGNNRYSYDVPETLELGKTYYWRIDEVNEGWGSGPVPPVNDRWKGEVWSFRTTGLAYNVYPADGAKDIPALNLLLRWTAGTDANGHDVYFGTDFDEVEDANTSTAGIYRGPTQSLSDVNYLVEDLDVSKRYYWRIDEVNAATVKGDVWRFTTGVFLIVDSFDSYVDKDAIRAVWDTFYLTDNGAEIFVSFGTVDANLVRDGNSMMFAYRNYKKSGSAYVGAETEAALPLEVGTDWTAGGVKALVLYFYGDEDNAQEGQYYAFYHITNDQMYVALEDGGANVGVVKYDTEHGYDMNDIAEAEWHEWNVDLAEPCLADVNMANVAKVYIGFGGTEKTGQSKAGAGMESGNYDTVWFDDIRLYPPRCMPEMTGRDVLHASGDFTEDCSTDYFDLDIMATDWLVSDFCAVGLPAKLTDFPDETSHWVTGHIGGAIDVDVDNKVTVNRPNLTGLTNMTISAWVKRHGAQTADVGIVISRELNGEPAEDSTGLEGGSSGDSVSYCWNQIKATWQFDSGLVVADANWTFIAMSVDPTGCTLYAKDACEAMQTPVRHDLVYDPGPLQQFKTAFWIGRGYSDGRYWKGGMDDVRIYGYNLDDANIGLLANKTGEPNPGPVYWYKFNETEGLSATDSGVGGELTYYLPPSIANLTDPEPQDERSVNFLDYRMMAEHWLEQHPWP